MYCPKDILTKKHVNYMRRIIQKNGVSWDGNSFFLICLSFFSLFLFCFILFLFVCLSLISFFVLFYFVIFFVCFSGFFIISNFYLEFQSCVTFYVYIIFLEFEFYCNEKLYAYLKKSNEKKVSRFHEISVTKLLRKNLIYDIFEVCFSFVGYSSIDSVFFPSVLLSYSI